MVMPRAFSHLTLVAVLRSQTQFAFVRPPGAAQGTVAAMVGESAMLDGMMGFWEAGPFFFFKRK